VLAIALEQLRAGRHATLPVGLPRPAANCGWKRGSGLHGYHANCEKQKDLVFAGVHTATPQSARRPAAAQAGASRNVRAPRSLADWHEIANSKLAALLDEADTDGRPAWPEGIHIRGKLPSKHPANPGRGGDCSIVPGVERHEVSHSRLKSPGA
jgi:hypothetical protein